MIAAETELTSDAMDVDDFDGEPMQDDGEDLDGEPMMDDEDVDGEPMEYQLDEHPSTEPQVEVKSSAAAEASRREALAASIAAKLNKAPSVPTKLTESDLMDAGPGFARKRQRPKAEDMFADSDGDG